MIKGPVVGIIAGTFLLVAVGAGGWYYCAETLMLSEIVGDNIAPGEAVLVNLFDFDTGLTRYDLHNLKSKSAYWDKRMEEISTIQDPLRMQAESDMLLAEMMKDPSMKKIMRKVGSQGSQLAMSVIKSMVD